MPLMLYIVKNTARYVRFWSGSGLMRQMVMEELPLCMLFLMMMQTKRRSLFF